LRLRYSARARSQLLLLREFIVDQGGADAGRRIAANIRNAAELLRHFPQAGRPGRA